MWEPAMDARRYRWRYRWSVAWEAEGGRAGQTVELNWGEDRRSHPGGRNFVAKSSCCSPGAAGCRSVTGTHHKAVATFLSHLQP